MSFSWPLRTEQNFKVDLPPIHAESLTRRQKNKMDREKHNFTPGEDMGIPKSQKDMPRLGFEPRIF